MKACVSIYREAIKSQVEKVNNISSQVKFRVVKEFMRRDFFVRCTFPIVCSFSAYFSEDLNMGLPKRHIAFVLNIVNLLLLFMYSSESRRK